ncbi:hypothetical protein SAMN05428949_6117 [Chitinophaga sp. YR627]|uniref:hypothetical protein n=1 Tax=Chitinophaga sp. YR627 TaxID=1881041 RepID=UPI0008F2E044|nr:hypothetical protein [Chitinophaga sp. YR627]SFO67590.1 hypothetical protein SAMN05428949_6117 [Chitinophaga sp. YR627]
MTNIKQGQASSDKHSDKDHPHGHISKDGRKEDDDAIYLQPDENNTLQTPEEYAKDKGKRPEDGGDEISVNTEE